MALSATSCTMYPELSTPPHPLSELVPTDLSSFAEANQRIEEMILDINQDKRVGHKRFYRSLNNDEKPETCNPDISGQAACNGTIPAKTKKSGANDGSNRVKKAKISKAPNGSSSAGRKRKVRPFNDDAARPSNRSLLDGNVSDTRFE